MTPAQTDTDFLKHALEKAKESVAKGGFPAGAVVVKDGAVIGEGISIGAQLHDPTSHGEMAAIRHACLQLETTDLGGAVLYASMQPCLMCFSAVLWSGISKIVYACPKNKVSPDYYGGHYETQDINKTLLRPIPQIHIPQLEPESLRIVHAWEQALGLC